MRVCLKFSFFFFFSLNLFSQNGDIFLLRKINLNRNKDLDNTFRFISNTAAPLSIASPLTVVATGLITKDKGLVNKGLVMGASAMVSGVLTTGLKYAVNRKRPFVTYPDIDKQSKAGSYSFPSGHTSSVFATATSLSLAFPKWYVIAPAYTWASAVAYSRMDLGVHYPTDVLAGAIIGAGSAYLCYKVEKWWRKKQCNCPGVGK